MPVNVKDAQTPEAIVAALLGVMHSKGEVILTGNGNVNADLSLVPSRSNHRAVNIGNSHGNFLRVEYNPANSEFTITASENLNADVSGSVDLVLERLGLDNADVNLVRTGSMTSSSGTEHPTCTIDASAMVQALKYIFEATGHPPMGMKEESRAILYGKVSALDDQVRQDRHRSSEEVQTPKTPAEIVAQALCDMHNSATGSAILSSIEPKLVIDGSAERVGIRPARSDSNTFVIGNSHGDLIRVTYDPSEATFTFTGQENLRANIRGSVSLAVGAVGLDARDKSIYAYDEEGRRLNECKVDAMQVVQGLQSKIGVQPETVSAETVAQLVAGVQQGAQR